jgi:hypothetical protein
LPNSFTRDRTPYPSPVMNRSALGTFFIIYHNFSSY